MITITNLKVSGFAPQWAPFRGFSLLFDNPGEDKQQDGDLLNLRCSVDTNPQIRLYQTFAESLGKIGRDLLMTTYLFCSLPSYSYHVTVWDGVNDSNVSQINSEYRAELERFLNKLPNSLSQPTVFSRLIDHSPLVTSKTWGITFKFTQLALWGHQVLVALLASADAESQRAFDRIVEERKILSNKVNELLGVHMSQEYSPHVSLGYFANKEHAELAINRVDTWTEMFQKDTCGLTITYNTIRLYGFSDMSTFVKRQSLTYSPGETWNS